MPDSGPRRHRHGFHHPRTPPGLPGGPGGAAPRRHHQPGGLLPHELPPGLPPILRRDPPLHRGGVRPGAGDLEGLRPGSYPGGLPRHGPDHPPPEGGG